MNGFKQIEKHLFQCETCGEKVRSGIARISEHWTKCTGKEFTDELIKCRESPVYFYNNYVKQENEGILTEEKYKAMIESMRNAPLKLRNQYKKPVTLEEAYSKLPNFLKPTK